MAFKTFVFEIDGHKRQFNVEDMAFALDRVACLAWKAKFYKIKGEIEIFGVKFTVSPNPDFYFPSTPDFKVLLAHLKAFGILTNCNPNLSPEKCPTKFPMTAHRMKMFEAYGKEAGKPVFILAFENADRWTITKQRRDPKKEQTTKSIMIGVPPQIHAALQKIATQNFMTISAQCRHILVEYLKSSGVLDDMTIREDQIRNPDKE